MVKGSLFLVPTFLGEGDATMTMPEGQLAILENIRHFAVEEIRSARRYLRARMKTFPIDDSTFYPIGKHADERNMAIVQACKQGHDVAVLSEAGCPGVADPGAALVSLAHAHQIKVVPWVGPSSLLLALMASGMSGQQFAFRGYLPVQPAERKAKIKWLEGLMERTGETQIFIETPFRNEALLQALTETLKPATQLAVAVDLTLPTEEIRAKAAGQFGPMDLRKRPAVFLIGKR